MKIKTLMAILAIVFSTSLAMAKSKTTPVPNEKTRTEITFDGGAT